MEHEKKEKTTKIVFSKETDSAINGYAIGASFLAIGLFLLLKPDYFLKPIASYVVGAVIGLFGTFGIGIELSKSAKVKGIENIALGALAVCAWLMTYIYIHSFWANLLFFVVLIIGCYAVFLGLFQGMYSIFDNNKKRSQLKDENTEKPMSKGSVISQVVLFLTQLCGLGLAVVNVIKAVSS